ncbi:unnamed protein product [Cylindrotheca closterium]|uniref:Uncharacterized protein n=1 Tax=Cylindrotheca closterium TaxID=2856 RepID=A0AAD2FNV8_9STRA|nr:unnamed protein product [Cylindrotheca closterium]
MSNSILTEGVKESSSSSSSPSTNNHDENMSTTTTTKRPRQERLSPAAIAAANSSHLTGRRGDIRMHKAVAARMADPSISLYDALVIGGFDYPSDDSATTVDEDKVTLGQRKNQLSRRLRLAKRQKKHGEKKGSKTMDHGGDHDSCSTPPPKNPTICAHSKHEHNHQPSTPTLLAEQEAACSQQQQHHHHHHHHHDDGAAIIETTNTDATAIASLLESAQSVGLTLQQLAETIASNRTTLSSLVMARDQQSQCCDDKSSSISTTRQKQKKVALRLHQIESKALYDKCLVLADADLDDDYAPLSKQHLQFCFQAWQTEGKRLGGLMEKHHPDWIQQLHSDGNKVVATGNKRTRSTMTTNSFDHPHNKKKHHQGHHNHNHNHNKKPCHNQTGLHIHRLDGQCGHKPIIHHPKDGVPHIDFIVGDMVECYHGVDPIKRNKAPFTAAVPPSERVIKWQSKYTCGEMDCSGECPSTGTPGVVAGVDPHVVVVTNPPVPPPPIMGVQDTSTTVVIAPNDQYLANLQPPPPPPPPPAAPPALEPKSIPIAKIRENDPEWNFEPDESMDDLLNGLLMHNELVY